MKRNRTDTLDQPRTIKATKKNSHVIQKVSFGQLPTTASGKNYVAELQKQIEEKNAQIEALTTQLARNDKVNMDSIQADLNRLQCAFDQVAKMNDKKLEPIIKKYRQSTAELESKIYVVETLKNAAHEREKARDRMQDIVERMTHELPTVDVHAVDETPLINFLQKIKEIQDSIETTHRQKQFQNRTYKLGSIINQSLTDQLSQIQEREKQASKRSQAIQQELNAHDIQQPVTINDEWVLARHSTHKLHIMLEDAKRSIRYLRETAEQLATSNKKTSEELTAANEEIQKLNKYFPNSPHSDLSKKTPGTSRSDLTVLQTEKDVTEIMLSISRKKTMATKGTLESLQAKLSEVTSNYEKSVDELEEIKIERENIEKELQKSISQRGELISRQEFSIEQGKLLDLRITEQKEILESIKQKVLAAQNEIERQENAIQLNEEMAKLKSMNFDRYTSTLSNIKKKFLIKLLNRKFVLYIKIVY